MPKCVKVLVKLKFYLFDLVNPSRELLYLPTQAIIASLPFFTSFTYSFLKLF